jgi:hypothetical protein
MLRKSILFVVVLSLSSLALAQEKAKQQVLPEGAIQGDATTNCDVNFKSGISTTTTEFCVTVNGNIAQFSLATEQMIGLGEGYGICDNTNKTAYFDYAQSDSGNWNSPTFTHSGNIVTIKRITSDGIWELTQTITNEPASSSGFGSAKVSMKLQNLSGVSRSAQILRYADVDANSDFTNHFDTTSTTAIGLDGNFQHGMMITNNTFNNNFGYLTGVLDIAGLPDPCKPFNFLPSSLPFVGDGSILSFWSFTIAHKGSATVVSTYKGI